MIEFRCWYCNRRHTEAEEQVGETILCGCRNRLRVPRRSGGPCRIKTIIDRLVEAVVYGGGGALLAFGVTFLIFGRAGLFLKIDQTWPLLVAPPMIAFLAGAFGGEPLVNAVGRLLRSHETD